MEKEFTWIPFYKEFAEKLLEFKNDRKSLLKFIYSLDSKYVGYLHEEDNRPLKDICPFTVMGIFNRGTTFSNRTIIAGEFKNFLNISSKTPTDFNGIPVLNNLKSYFFAFSNTRERNDIKNLWELFEKVQQDPYSIRNIFNEVIKQRQIRINITMALYWVLPEKFIALDSQNSILLKKYGIAIKSGVPDFDAYIRIIETVKMKMETGQIEAKSFPEFSYNAWIGDSEEVNDKNGNALNEPSNLKKNYQSSSNNYPLNQILYGPPGTGKTFNTINKALEILEPSFDLNQDRKIVKEKFDEYLVAKQIVFTTFHQSMSYEDFVEGIKPQKPEEGDTYIKYDTEPGIFKSLCDNAKTIRISAQKIDWDSPKYYKMSVGGKERPDFHDWCIENNLIGLGWGGSENLSKYIGITTWIDYRDRFTSEFPRLVEESRFNIQATYAFINMRIGDIVVVSKGNHIIDAIGIIKSDYFWDDKNPVDFFHFRKVEWIAKNMNTTPDRFFNKKISQQAIYEFSNQDIKKESFKELGKPVKEKTKPFVLIIDEINRGNISQIFGELITLIEEDKRLGNQEAITLTLPYSKTEFGVPSNLYIIGTMNTADRSVEALDAALRRRFSFTEMPPRPDLIDEVGKADDGMVDGIKLSSLLHTINYRIELLLDKDHQIGHSYFLPVETIYDLKSVFKNKIIPLLQEYFYGDYGKIGLVLGNGFVSVKSKESGSFARFDDSYDVSGLADRIIYQLNDVDALDFDMQKAVEALFQSA